MLSISKEAKKPLFCFDQTAGLFRAVLFCFDQKNLCVLTVTFKTENIIVFDVKGKAVKIAF